MVAHDAGDRQGGRASGRQRPFALAGAKRGAVERRLW